METTDMTSNKEGFATQSAGEPVHDPVPADASAVQQSEPDASSEAQEAGVSWSDEVRDRVEDTVQETASDRDADTFEELATHQHDQSNPDSSQAPANHEKRPIVHANIARISQETGLSLRRGEPEASGESSDAVNDSTQEKRQERPAQAVKDVPLDTQSGSESPIAKTENKVQY